MSSELPDWDWCCPGFSLLTESAGERGLGVVIDKKSDESPLFLIQHRTLDPGAPPPPNNGGALTLISEVEIRFCPFCGADLHHTYGTRIETLRRPDLVAGVSY